MTPAAGLSPVRRATAKAVPLLALVVTSLAAASPAAAQGDGNREQAPGWLSGARYFTEPLADPREPRTALGILSTDLFGPGRGRDADPPAGPVFTGDGPRETQASVQLGGGMALWEGRRGAGPGAPGLLVGVQGGIRGRFRLGTIAKHLIGTDWTIALPVEARWGRWSARSRLLHWSSHLGDEIQEAGENRRIDFTYDAVELLVAFRPWSVLRVYGGGSAVLRSHSTRGLLDPDGEPISDEGHVQLGGEARWPISLERGLALVAAADWKVEARSLWRSQLSTVGGVEVRRSNRSVRLLGRVYDGPSQLGQFFLSHERIYAVELSLRW